MGWRCQWRITCEQCGTVSRAADSSKDAEASALARGWVRAWIHYGAHHLCPSCAGGVRPEWWPREVGVAEVTEPERSDCADERQMPLL